MDKIFGMRIPSWNLAFDFRQMLHKSANGLYTNPPNPGPKITSLFAEKTAPVSNPLPASASASDIFSENGPQLFIDQNGVISLAPQIPASIEPIVAETVLVTEEATATVDSKATETSPTTQMAQKVLDKGIETAPRLLSKAALTQLFKIAGAAVKAAPQKLFVLGVMPWLAYMYNKTNSLSNINVILSAEQRKIVIIKFGAGNVEKEVALEVAPGKEIKALQHKNPDNHFHNTLMPSATRTSSFFTKYIASPLTAFMLHRENHKKIYHVVVKDNTESRIFGEGLQRRPVVKWIDLSPDETLRISHVPSRITKDSKPTVSGDPEAWDVAQGAHLEVGEPLTKEICTQHIPLDVKEGYMTGEYVTVVQKVL